MASASPNHGLCSPAHANAIQANSKKEREAHSESCDVKVSVPLKIILLKNIPRCEGELNSAQWNGSHNPQMEAFGRRELQVPDTRRFGEGIAQKIAGEAHTKPGNSF